MNQSRTVIEFGTSKLICMAGTKEEKALEIEGSCIVDYAGIKDDNWIDAGGVAEALEQAVAGVEKECRRSARDVTFGIPACYTDVVTVKKTLNLAGKAVTEAEINALESRCAPGDTPRWILIDSRPAYYLDAEQNVYITPPIGTRTTELTACYAHTLAFEPFVNDIDSMLADMKIRVEGMAAEPLANALYLIPQQARDGGAILLDIGRNDTSVSAVFGDAVQAVNVIHMGGSVISDAIARRLGVDGILAENIKRAYVYGMDCSPDMQIFAKDREKRMRSFSNSQIRDIVEPATSMLLAEIAQAVKEMNEFVARSTPVYLTGGGLMLQSGSAPLIEKVLKRKTAVTSVKNVKLQNPIYHTALALLDNAENSVYHLDGEEPKQGVLGRLMGAFFTRKK